MHIQYILVIVKQLHLKKVTHLQFTFKLIYKIYQIHPKYLISKLLQSTKIILKLLQT